MWDFNIVYLSRLFVLGDSKMAQWVKRVCHKIRLLEFNSSDPNGGSRELTPASYPLTTLSYGIHALLHPHRQK